ncbi:hypothetical protein PINS_up009141 [Pythium insidiosum]|nr:hypothetical protein PINS_up009141 [Pythium insidiosum]
MAASPIARSWSSVFSLERWIAGLVAMRKSGPYLINPKPAQSRISSRHCLTLANALVIEVVIWNGVFQDIDVGRCDTCDDGSETARGVSSAVSATTEQQSRQIEGDEPANALDDAVAREIEAAQ